ncbi:T9SS type A sorting domain-containing protein [Candidatus Cloacimonadota bacterium]
MKKIIIIILCINSLFLLADPPNWQPITGTQYSMIMFARIIFEGTYFDNTGDNIVAAFGPGGETDCRDIAGWQPSTPDGFWYFNVVGNTNGEEISFKIYDDATDTVYDCNQTFIFDDNATIGSPTNPILLTVGGSLIIGDVSLITTTPPAGNIQNAEITNGSFTVNPDIDGHYELPANPGTHNVTASLQGYNPVTIAGVAVVQNQNTENIDFSLIDWEPITGTQFSMVLMGEVLMGNELIVYNGANQIGAFGPGGENDCRGVAVWQEPNQPYWDGYWFFTIVGNVQMQSISFKVFESSTSAVYSCLETVSFDNNSTLGSPEEPFTLNIDINIDQTMDLGQNWNWISLYVHPDDTTIQAVFGSLGSDVYQVKNQSQSTTYYSASQSWIGNLMNINDGEAYLVQMINSYADFVVNGEPISISSPIDLTEGWNWSAYYPRTILPVENALHSIESSVIQVKNQSQTANYINPPGAWVGDLLQMEPNTGYKIMMNDTGQLIYGTSPVLTDNQPKNTDPTDDPPTWSIITGTQYSMVVMASIMFETDEFVMNGDNMAGAFGPIGEEDCRSIAVWQEPNPPYYENGFWYFTVVGDELGDEISFMIYDESTDAVYTCEETVIFDDNETLGQPDAPITLTCGNSGANNSVIPNTDLELQIYPNPFNPSTTISFNTSSEQYEQIELLIYNLKGQKIKNLTPGLYQPELSEGREDVIISATWNGMNDNGQPVSSGIYFCKLKAGKEVLTKKLMLLK